MFIEIMVLFLNWLVIFWYDTTTLTKLGAIQMVKWIYKITEHFQRFNFLTIGTYSVSAYKISSFSTWIICKPIEFKCFVDAYKNWFCSGWLKTIEFSIFDGRPGPIHFNNRLCYHLHPNFGTLSTHRRNSKYYSLS